MTPLHPAAPDEETGPTALTVGRRVRALRLQRGLTVQELGGLIGRAASQVSVIENGKRELKITELRTVASALGATIEQLLDPSPPSRRDALEIELARAQAGPLFEALQLPALTVRKSVPDEALETILALHAEFVRLHERRASTPEEARRANTALRADQRERHNYYPELEATAREASRVNRPQRRPLISVGRVGVGIAPGLHPPSRSRSADDHQIRDG